MSWARLRNILKWVAVLGLSTLLGLSLWFLFEFKKMGSEVLGNLQSQPRGPDWVEYKDVPQVILKALIVIENPDYDKCDQYTAIKSVAGLFLGDGGSSGPNCAIVSQVVRIAVQDVKERQIHRHFREFAGFYALLANYSKEEVLEIYINQVYVGEGQFGLPQGARLYYSKDLKELSVDEIAGLISVLNSPGFYSPLTQPEKHAQRKLQVLDRLKQAKISI